MAKWRECSVYILFQQEKRQNKATTKQKTDTKGYEFRKADSSPRRLRLPLQKECGVISQARNYY